MGLLGAIEIKIQFTAVAATIVILALTANALELEPRKGFNPSQRRSSSASAAIITGGGHDDPITILTSPGEPLGSTYYDMQSNGSTGNRVALDGLGGLHFSWTGASSSLPTSRHLYYKFISENGDSIPAVRLAGRDQSGFAGIAIFGGVVNPSSENCAIVGYHNSAIVDDRFAVELTRGSGAFAIDSIGFPSSPGQCLWPCISVDINDNIHAVATRSDIPEGALRYHIYSRKAYGSSLWSPALIIDSTYTVSPVITSSRVSSKTAIAWTSPTFQDSNEYDNDLVYLESPDGVTWNVAGRVNITNYPASAQGDTVLRAYSDVDAVYDLDDHLHLIWNVSYVTRDTADKMVVLYRSALYHWTAQTGIDLIYDHPQWLWTCDMGAWNLSISKMSIGVDPDSNFLYATFTRFDVLDYAHFDTANGDPNPCGGDNAMPCANGELFMTWSRDGGDTWVEPGNITDSPSPDCLSGDCDNDNWSSLAEVVDDYLHIVYINDKDAGGAALGEGDPTDNPVMYLRIPNPTRTISGGCSYVPGDINGNGSSNGIDVVYGVIYLKGGDPPPDSCDCRPDVPTYPFYGAGDVNGSCTFNGIDITYFVAYLKGLQPALEYCPDCPPAR
ncbi:MAG: hypothetical protein A2W25_13995 [candidate division Zixibacteria bacterium RBG_16_53_22]|nr:MAG: hypothetical protein A2W25_13995 [candidate division Zixibacteria bacterium RBG_16_53_22]